MQTAAVAPNTDRALREEPRIGPNAVLQTFVALDELEPALADAVRAAVGADAAALTSMIPEAWFTRALEAVREALPDARAEAVLRRSGALTARYVAAHRIPAPVRLALGVLPARAGVPLLLRAFGAHAWTFAGAGRFEVEGARLITLEGAPTCRRRASAPQGAYYEAAFEGLLALAAPRVQVREVACQALGARRCRFVIASP